MNQAEDMKRLLTHFHLYYHDQVDYFIEKMSNISGVVWTLVVTYSEWNEESARKLREFKPDVVFRKTDNIGYDIWPFIDLIQHTDLKDYDFVMKLHTKRSIGACRCNIIKLRGFDWRNVLVDGMLYNKQHFLNVLKLFENDPSVGMVSSLLTYVERDYYESLVKNELDRLGWEKFDPHTCMGTMFMMRSSILSLLQRPDIDSHLFECEVPESGTFFHKAHLYERIFSHLAINSGLRHVPVWHSKKDSRRIAVAKFFEPVGKFIFCCEKEGPERKKFIRILGIKKYLKYKSKH
ncbi:MAG: hypothetical protein J1F16_04470 [Muribaculaceae bacterium]|nr:hypothetical protein [Muribaculaceae bacterium]